MQGCSSTAGEVMAAMTKLPQTPRYQVLWISATINKFFSFWLNS